MGRSFKFVQIVSGMAKNVKEVRDRVGNWLLSEALDPSQNRGNSLEQSKGQAKLEQAIWQGSKQSNKLGT